MRRYSLFLAALLLLALASASVVQAEYWFQSGARAAGNADHNTGASVQIQTIIPQNVVSGSMAFWVGETLGNGAFVQVGYSISNQTGNLTTNCVAANACTTTELIRAGDAEWFYEYFKPGDNTTFYGNTGPDGSAGLNGTFHTYSFYSRNNTWYFKFDNTTLGSVNLGVSNSSANQPIAVGEVANTSGTKNFMKNVVFANLSAYKFNSWLPVQTATGIVSYGAGSRTALKNPYGVAELGSRVNYFAVGSGEPTSNNNTRLWNLGYRLTVNSQYGNIASRNVYVAYTPQTITAPQYVNLTKGSRAVFAGWTGFGAGYYNGTKNSVQLLMTTNITETANWKIQYLVNVSSPYGTGGGSGWYNSSSYATYSLGATNTTGNGRAVRFSRWSNGDAAPTNSTRITSPTNLTALWQYRQALQAQNGYGQNINVQYFMINGQRYNSTAYLNATATSVVSGAFYKGLLIPVTGVNITQASPPATPIMLPVYNISIVTSGLLGFPINASVALSFANGTRYTLFSGPTGRINLQNVPLGTANSTVTYFGMAQNKNLSYNVPNVFTFFSFSNLVGLLALIGIAIFVLNKKYHWDLIREGSQSKQQ